MRTDAAADGVTDGRAALAGWCRQRTALIVLGCLYTALCIAPHLARLRGPSLFADDVVRVAELQDKPFSQIVLRPFNEHVAPLFEGISWVAWRTSGRRLSAAPAAFTAAALVPLVVMLGLLGLLIRRETGSAAAALAGVALMSLASLPLETYWWYSASSFTWALAATLAAWLAAVRQTGPGLALALVASLAAPAFSAVGLLAGPVVAVRVAADERTGSRFRALIPALGTLLYLILALPVHERQSLAGTLRTHADLATGLVAALHAPVSVLLPAQVGAKTGILALGLPVWLEAVLGLAVAAGAFAWAIRSPRRPLALGGLALILGGYLLIYPARGGLSAEMLLRIQRYHLFPQAGLVLLAAARVGPWCQRRLDSPRSALRLGVLVAAGCLALHGSRLVSWASTYAFPDQAPALAALERLDRVCRAEGITRAQVGSLLDAPHFAWLPMKEYSPLILVRGGDGPARVPDAQVRGRLWTALRPGDRELICTGMDATPHLRALPDQEAKDALAVGRLVRTYRMQPGAGAADSETYVATGRPSFLEYEIQGEPSARALALRASGPRLEVWWSEDGESWQPSRSVQWGPGSPAAGQAWAIPLERLPHLDVCRTRRLRIVVREPGTLAVEAPRLVR